MQWLEHRVPPPVVMVLTAGAMAGVAHVFASPALPMPPAVATVLAVVLLVVGSLLVPLGALTFRRARTTPSPVHPDRASALVTTGPYRFTRNPMYLGLSIVLVAWALRLGALAAWAGPVAFVAYITRFQIRSEERALTALFGEAYAAYRAKVRRWL